MGKDNDKKIRCCHRSRASQKSYMWLHLHQATAWISLLLVPNEDYKKIPRQWTEHYRHFVFVDFHFSTSPSPIRYAHANYFIYEIIRIFSNSSFKRVCLFHHQKPMKNLHIICHTQKLSACKRMSERFPLSRQSRNIAQFFTAFKPFSRTIELCVDEFKWFPLMQRVNERKCVHTTHVFWLNLIDNKPNYLANYFIGCDYLANHTARESVPVERRISPSPFQSHFIAFDLACKHRYSSCKFDIMLSSITTTLYSTCTIDTERNPLQIIFSFSKNTREKRRFRTEQNDISGIKSHQTSLMWYIAM